jgi:alcohol dehydrogenase
VVLNPSFFCPTRLIVGAPYVEALTEVVGARRWAFVTSAGWIARGARDELAKALGPPIATIGDVPPNPKFSDIVLRSPALGDAEVVVAFGGGSVIDCAKGLAALAALDRDGTILDAHLREAKDLPAGFSPAPIVAVPTTSGTGSEITRWATVWGDDRIKYSLVHPALYPSHAVLDPAPCRSMPAEVTLYSALDALSHAIEAVWNRRHSRLTDGFAEAAIRGIVAALPQALERPHDLALRSELQIASVNAGFAMGVTQTALAHSISYPFTARFGLPHGFACSFTLPEIARFNMADEPERLAPVAAGFGCRLGELPDRMDRWMHDLGIGAFLDRYVAADSADAFDDNLITRARAANNLRPADGPAARAIAQTSLRSFCRPAVRRAAGKAAGG